MIAILALIATACGGSDGGSDEAEVTTTEAPATTEAPTTTAVPVASDPLVLGTLMPLTDLGFLGPGIESVQFLLLSKSMLLVESTDKMLSGYKVTRTAQMLHPLV